MSFLDDSRAGRAIRCWHTDRARSTFTSIGGMLAGAAVGALVNIALQKMGIVLPGGVPGELIAAAAFGGGTTMTMGAPFILPRSSKHAVGEWRVGADDLRALHLSGPKKYVDLAVETNARIRHLFAQDHLLGAMTEPHKRQLAGYLNDLAAALPHISIHDSDEKPWTSLPIWRLFRSPGGNVHAEQVAVLRRHPDDCALEEATREVESIAPTPRAMLDITAPALNRNRLRAETAQAVAYLETKAEIDAAIDPWPKLRVADAANGAFTAAPQAEEPAQDRPSAPAMKIKA